MLLTRRIVSLYFMFLRGKKQQDKLTDAELVTAFRERDDRDALGELFERYTHLVFGVSMKYLKNTEDAKDAVMQVFEKLMVELKQHEVEHFSSWLYTLTKNFCLMKLRADKTAGRHEECYRIFSGIHVELNDPMHQDNGTFSQARFNQLEEELKKLSDEQQYCIRLFYLESKSYAEICELTGYNPKQVKSYIQNGRRLLRQRMEPGQADDE